MASSKALFLLGVLFALVLLISSEVSALDDQTKESMESKSVEEAKYGGGCGYGCCRWYRYRHGCSRCCSYATQAPDAEFEDDTHN